MTKVWPLALLLAGCAGSKEGGTAGQAAAASQPTHASRPIPAVAFRLPTAGGSVRGYLLPALQPTPWSIAGHVSPARAAIGLDLAGRRLVYRDTAGAVASFDLVAFREKPIAPAGTVVAMGTDGTVLAVDAAGTVIESQPWGTRRWAGALGPGVSAAFAAPGARLIVVRRAGSDTLAVVSREAGVSVVAVAPDARDRAATRDGDAVAFATDSGVVLVEDREPQRPGFVALSGTPHALVFSPSGHRLYVALRENSQVAVIDRFQRRARTAVALPSPAAALRMDPWGRVLLARGSDGGGRETWVVGLAREHVLGRLEVTWSSDLPTVSQDGILLAREAGAVVAREVHSLDSLGAVPDGGGDLWFTGRWAPPSVAVAARQEARASPAAPGGTERERAAVRLWVQVSSSQNERWARALAAELGGARHRATVVPPRNPGEGWRVVLGPYGTREAADSAGRALGRPYWIVERGPETGGRP